MTAGRVFLQTLGSLCCGPKRTAMPCWCFLCRTVSPFESNKARERGSDRSICCRREARPRVCSCARLWLASCRLFEKTTCCIRYISNTGDRNGSRWMFVTLSSFPFQNRVTMRADGFKAAAHEAPTQQGRRSVAGLHGGCTGGGRAHLRCRSGTVHSSSPRAKSRQ